MVSWLDKLAAQSPVVVFLDDLDWAGAGTLDLPAIAAEIGAVNTSTLIKSKSATCKLIHCSP